MRKLTIERRKTFVACAMKMKVYVETDGVGDIVINNTPCVKLGTLKNGEKQTFEISEKAVKVYVIADSVSKDYCNDFYQLPEGVDDIELSGQNKFNLANGNAYVFDNNDNPEAAENRKKGKRTGTVVLVIAIVVGAIVGFLLGSGILFR